MPNAYCNITLDLSPNRLVVQAPPTPTQIHVLQKLMQTRKSSSVTAQHVRQGRKGREGGVPLPCLEEAEGYLSCPGARVPPALSGGWKRREGTPCPVWGSGGGRGRGTPVLSGGEREGKGYPCPVHREGG